MRPGLLTALNLFGAICTPRRAYPPGRDVLFFRPAPAQVAREVSDALDERKDLVAGAGVELEPRRVQQPKDRRLALGVSLQAINHRTNLLVDDLSLRVPDDAKGGDGGFHLVAGGRVDRPEVVHVPRVGSPPPLHVEAPVGVFGVDREPKGIDSNVRKGAAEVQTFLALDQVFPVDGPDHGAPQNVVLGVPFLVQARVLCLLRNVGLGFLEDVELRILVEFQVFEHGRFGDFPAGRFCGSGRRSLGGKGGGVAR
ncbi:unnamed protein product [Pseudo-nitzschia multistriata]|uniref:Uncharacterized protein n=1 Tax=Pseudo-nitzschia multistriata TaxID=183589 RepID=A0A448ZQF0_9STRA|nr:unnamed protein product [Pseudo-nitzschia multistriata]